MVTIKDLAKAAGVSYSTVSRALNDHSGTNANTKKRIKKLAKEMGYETNVLARSLVTAQSNTIGFVLPDLSNPFFTTILDAITQTADQAGYNLLICSTEWDSEKEARELKMLSAKRVDGILLYPSEIIRDNRLDVLSPPVIVYGKVESGNVSKRLLIEVDNMDGSSLAVDHMLACGYERFAYLAGPDYSLSSLVRMAGYKQTLKKRGHSYRQDFIVPGKYSIASGYENAKKLLALPDGERPDAIICADDLIALGCLQAVSESGCQLGTDVGVIGFDDVPYASLPQIQLTTVRIPCHDMGEHGTEILIDNIRRKAEGREPNGCRIILYPELIVRKSTARHG